VEIKFDHPNDGDFSKIDSLNIDTDTLGLDISIQYWYYDKQFVDHPPYLS
jgi:hypothetical protein